MYLSDNRKCPKNSKKGLVWGYMYLKTRIVNEVLWSFWGDQPTFYRQRFSSYEFDQFSPHFGPILRFRPFLAFLGHFRLSEKYIYVKTPIVNAVLWPFWGVNRLSIASGSQVMNFWPILTLFWPNFEIQALFGIFGALPVVWEVHISEKTIVNRVLW